ncbi:hypothetical protein TNCV_756471, partial [Trichonephila clavipes]
RWGSECSQLNGYVNETKLPHLGEANPQVYVETPFSKKRLFGALYGLVESFFYKNDEATTLQSMVIGMKP